MRLRLFVVLSLLLAGGVASVEAGGYVPQRVYLPDHYPVGYSFAGYTKQASGLWYNGSAYASFVEYKVKELSSCGCYYYWQTYYDFKPAAAPLLAPVVNIKAPDFYERIADNLAADKEYARRAELLQVFYGGQTYGQQAYGQGYYKQRIDLYGGQYQYKQEQIYAPIDLNVALAQQGLNAEQALRIGPQVNQLFAQTIQQLGDSAGQAQLIRELRQAVVELQRANKPAATIQQKGNVPLPPPAILPPPHDERFQNMSFEQSVKIITERLLPSADPDKHMPKGGGQLTQAELRDFAAGKYEAIDAKHRCTECHVKQEVKFRLR